MRRNGLVDGAIAGAVGSAVLDAATFLDIAVRARPPSRTPEETVRRLADATHVDLGPEDRAANRRSGLGPLFGYAIGVGAGIGYAGWVGRRRVPPLPVAAAVLGGGVMLASSGSMTALGVTDPRKWRGVDWLSDIVPHLAYGFAAAATWRRLRSPGRRRG